MPSMFEHAGGAEAIHRLEEAFYAKVLADPLLIPLFGEGQPQHVDHLTAFTAESFGGPDRFSRELGFAHLIAVHRGLRITEEQRQRFVELYMAAVDESDLPDDEPFREAVRSHVEFGSRVAMQNSNADSDEDLHPLREVPRWSWAGTGSMIDLGDVSTWWDVEGDGEPLVLLHPGGADSRAYDDNLPGLAEVFRCYRYDRRGQGRTPDVGGPITFSAMTDDAIAFIETAVGAPAHLVGHSIGAPVGLLVAQKRPDLVRGLVFSEGVFHHDGWIPGVLDPLPPDVHEFLGGLYAEVSPHGAEHWPDVWARLDHEHHRAPALTTDVLAAIAVPTLLMFADNETEVRTEHMHAMHRALPNAQLAVIPGTGHGLLADKPDLCNRIITEFLAEATP